MHAGIFRQDCPSFVLAFILSVELFDYAGDGGMWWESGRGREPKKGIYSKDGGGVKPSGCHVNIICLFLYTLKAPENRKRPVAWNTLRVFTCNRFGNYWKNLWCNPSTRKLHAKYLQIHDKKTQPRIFFCYFPSSFSSK